jgi:RNA polymerase sigma-70 factor (ECF subfamily)
VALAASRFGSGDRSHDNFRVLFLAYHRRVRGFFARRTTDPSAIDDLTQETFLRLYQGGGKMEGIADFTAWLFQIAANVHRNRGRSLRAAKRSGQEEPLEVLEQMASPRLHPAASLPRGPEAPLEAVLDRERRTALARALVDLPPQMRRCAVLRFSAGLRYHEIAERLGISLDGVKAHLYQARKRLRIVLAEHFDEPVEDDP